MEEVLQLYESISLPYKYCKIPLPDEPDLVRKTKRFYWVNQIIPNVAKQAFKHAGFSPTNKKLRWNASWGKQYDSTQFDSCKCWQKVNHFSGAYLIGRKDQLHKRMTELRQRTDDKFTSFYPKSYLIPEDSTKLQESWKKKVLWIVKPVASSRGRGIHVVSSKESKAPQKSGTIVQYYISRPFLITGRKFDIRLYALVTSVSPLRIYLHTSGLARFATHEYDTTTPTDRHTHLTNFSVNKSDAKFIKSTSSDLTEEKVENSKWSLSFLLNYLDRIGIDSQNVMKELERVTCMTIIAGMCEVRSFHNRHVIHRHTSYELYGIDVILDEGLRPHIMEVNISPSLNSTDSPLDFRLKYPMVIDILNIARIIDCNPKLDNPCPGMALIDKECRLSMAKGRTTEVETLFKMSSSSSSSSLPTSRRAKTKSSCLYDKSTFSSNSSFQSFSSLNASSSRRSKLVKASSNQSLTAVSDADENDNAKNPSNQSLEEIQRTNSSQQNLNLNIDTDDEVACEKSVSCFNMRKSWNRPAFADFVMIRDFIEEKQRMGGFHRIYPKRKTMDHYSLCFNNMRYHDIVFGSWIKMTNDDRLKVLRKNWKVYKDTMDKIQAQLSSK